MSIGEYGYFWYKFGPHSQDLQDDAFKTKEYSKKEVELTKKTKEKISHFNKIINYKPEEVNDIEDWLEIVASIHYLLDIFPSRKRQKNEIIRRFEFKKGMDIEHDVLEEAYELVMNVWDFNIGEEERIET